MPPQSHSLNIRLHQENISINVATGNYSYVMTWTEGKKNLK